MPDNEIKKENIEIDDKNEAKNEKEKKEEILESIEENKKK